MYLGITALEIDLIIMTDLTSASYESSINRHSMGCEIPTSVSCLHFILVSIVFFSPYTTFSDS